ncbi:hypothetical protein MHK_001016, partial [Candidatus Magnetomorum sp. HK-1]
YSPSEYGIFNKQHICTINNNVISDFKTGIQNYGNKCSIVGNSVFGNPSTCIKNSGQYVTQEANVKQ